jgi:hypothetical protein
MKWYWRVRIYNKEGDYRFAQIVTERDLKIVDLLQDFYFLLTGCKMLLEGMKEEEFKDIPTLKASFENLWIYNAKQELSRTM